jgi:Chitobiase/beta-hexosaminidase C-terminal domain
MKKQTGSLILFLFFTLYAVSQQLFQLAPPFIKYGSVFFKDEVKVSLLFAQPGTIIRYTANGNEPSENDAAYREPIRINKNFTTVKAKVFGKDFLPSETVQATFVKDGLPVMKVEYTAPDENNTGEGPNTLIDNKGGIVPFTNKTWLGFRQDTVSITITLQKKQKVSAVLFNILQDYNSWIFFPAKAEVYGSVNTEVPIDKQGELFFTAKENTDVNVCRPYIIRFKKKVKTDKIKLQLYLLKNIPGWHPGKGEKSWIFIDEVKVY